MFHRNFELNTANICEQKDERTNTYRNTEDTRIQFNPRLITRKRKGELEKTFTKLQATKEVKIFYTRGHFDVRDQVPGTK